MKKLISTVTVAAAVTMSGCASIISDSNYPVTINSSPNGANFTVTNEQGFDVHSGKTPSTVTLQAGDGYFSKASYTVKLYKDGYEAKEFTVTPTLDGWYIANILFGGLIGMLVVDPATGAMWKLPQQVNNSLNEQTAGVSNAKLTIALIEDLSSEQREQLVKLK